MEKRIFPPSVINETVEVYDSHIAVRSRMIYLILIGVMLFAVSALPLIYVDVAVQSRGTFQSALQRNSLMSSVGGRLETWNMTENRKVKKGDILAIVRAEVVQLEQQGLEERLAQLEEFVFDLGKLLRMELEGNSVPLTPSRLFTAIPILHFSSHN
ncbi:biotin/lipoyl-binding protein [Mongoliibacter ruber]|uniref:Biotin/lipoyl-binding protein n=1 Tax=Mongoliibacter ruber TaxID=1750599 RepID=A0A2T0WMM5_9BACT|nr:biotin/lipoyl-binding protein [Mongoliibacter ruber]PRY87949.1 biotin/lipoyl-binding protein [Mongoliibacter ruber]